jgi:phosphonate transport system permease protein
MAERSQLPPRPRSWLPAWTGFALALLYAAGHDLELSFEDLAYGLDDVIEYFRRYSAPDFAGVPGVLELMLQTLATALWGTMLALLLGGLLAPLAARNLSPGRWTYLVVREVLNLMRAMPDLLLALVFVAALGLGPLPGVLALGVHTAGFMGKFCAESMERVEPGIYEALAATGATLPQRIMYAAWPSVLREAAGYALIILDRNVRMAAVLGLVGAGGIGLALHDTLRLFDYGRSSALILVMLVTIIVIDTLSSSLRRRLG